MHRSLQAMEASHVSRYQTDMGICRKSYRAIHIFALCRHLRQSESGLQRWKESKTEEAVERRRNDRKLGDVAVLFFPARATGLHDQA